MARALLLGKPPPLLGSLSLDVKSLWGRDGYAERVSELPGWAQQALYSHK